MKKVYKYGTGHPIPKGAVYLCTKVETITEQITNDEEFKKGTIRTFNELVWHYFLVEVKNEK